MASSLLISHFDIPWTATRYIPAQTFDEDHSHFNLIGGRRAGYAKHASASAGFSIVYDLGPTVTKAIDHIIIARADALITQGVTTAELDSSPDNSVFTSRFHTASFASATLYGPRSADFLSEFATTSAFRYWKYILAATSCKFVHSKVSFGVGFDMGIDPDGVRCEPQPASEAEFVASSGAVQKVRTGDAQYTIRVRWENVTDEKMEEFTNKVVRYRHVQTYFLYTPATPGRHELLDNNRVIHVRLTEATRTFRKNNKNSIETTWVEELG